MSKVIPEKLIGPQVVRFATFYGTRMFITAFTKAVICSYPEPDPGDFLPIYSFVNIFPHLHLGLRSGPFLRFPHQNRVYAFPLYVHMPGVSRSCFDNPDMFRDEYRLRSFSLCSRRIGICNAQAELTQWAEFNRGSARGPRVLEGEPYFTISSVS